MATGVLYQILFSGNQLEQSTSEYLRTVTIRQKRGEEKCRNKSDKNGPNGHLVFLMKSKMFSNKIF